MRNRLALVDEALINRSLVADALLLGLVLGESDCEEVLDSLESEGVEALLLGLVDLLEDLGLDAVGLVEALHSVLDDLSDGDDGAELLAHLSEGDLGGVSLAELGEDVLGVVSEGLLVGDADLVGV